MPANRRRTRTPDPERSVRTTAIAFLVWHSIGTVVTVALLVYTTFALASAYAAGAAPAPIVFFGLEMPPILSLGLLFLLTGALITAGYLFGIGVVRERWRDAASEKTLVRIGSGLSVLYLVGLVWAFTQTDSVLFLYYALSGFLCVAVDWQVRELTNPGSSLLGRLPGEKRPSTRERIAQASRNFVEGYEVEQVRPGLQRIVTGYCQLMVIWGSMEFVMSLTYLSKVNQLWEEGAGLLGVMGSGIVTGFILLIAGTYTLVCGIVNVRGRTNERAMRVGTWMCFGGLVAGAAWLVLAVLEFAAGSPDGVEQCFCAVIGTALMAAAFLRTRERASWADAWRAEG